MNEMNDFLWYSYFGITFEKAKGEPKKARESCMQRAYRDLCRTLKYSKSESELKKQEKGYADKYREKKKEFIEKEKKCIAKQIAVLFEQILKGTWNFDKWHRETCDEIKKIAQKQEAGDDFLFSDKNNSHDQEKDFSYGQAQKWLNMTLKYMLLMELWDGPMQKIEDSEEKLHIPVDAYVIEAVKKYVEPFEGEKWECLNSSKANYEKSWSKWESEQYDEFQRKMRKYIEDQKGEEEQKYSTPMNWEQRKWIEIAKEKN